uniref:Beta-keratin 14 n=1 Tax=Gekko gecko TaxID=36310 RepID=B4X9R6_GEKGE|nr:beta-keratin 14 [Gekko gecko]
MTHGGPHFDDPACVSAPGFGSAGLGYGGHHSGALIGAGSPSFAVPSVASSPVIGFGSAGLDQGFASGVPSASLGVLSGVNPSCINQIPPAEVLVQPPPIVMTLPGPILSATGQPVFVGGNTPCAVSYGGSSSGLSGGSGLYGGFGRGLSGGSFGAIGGRLGSYGGSRRGNLILGHQGSICLPPQ